MARTTDGPRWFESKKSFFVTLGGVRHNLGPDKTEAQRRYEQLTQRDDPQRDDPQLGEAIRGYLAHLKSDGRSEDYLTTSGRFGSKLLASPLATMPIADLRPQHIRDWLDDHPGWGPSTRGIVITLVKASVNWAEGEGIGGSNPFLRKLKKDRGIIRDLRLNKEIHEAILRVSKRFLANILVALYDSGARPGEIRRVTVGDYQPRLGAWILNRHKTSKKVEKPRVIYLSERLNRLSQLESEGRGADAPLFRTRFGTPWNRLKLEREFRKKRDSVLPGCEATLYEYRHLFAHQFLLGGGSIAQLAELMGNSIQVVQKHYGHLQDGGKVLRDQVLRFSSNR